MFAVWGYVVSHQKPARDGEYYAELNEEELCDCIGEVTLVDIRAVIEKLCAPDPRSRTPDEEGRRLVKVGQFSYRVVNGAHYQKLIDDESRRAYWRLKKKEERQEKKESQNVPSSRPVGDAGPPEEPAGGEVSSLAEAVGGRPSDYAASRKNAAVPVWEKEVQQRAAVLGLDAALAVEVWRGLVKRGGKDASGQKVKNFDAYLKSACVAEGTPAVSLNTARLLKEFDSM